MESSPRAILKTAYQKEYLQQQEVWLSMIQDRNLSSHEYNEDAIIAMAERISQQYLLAFTQLQTTIASNIPQTAL